MYSIALYMKKKLSAHYFALILTVFLLPFCAHAQKLSKTERIDSLKQKFQKDSARIYRFQKFRLRVALDQRGSWISNTKLNKTVPVSVNGLQIGVILFERHTIGIGFYEITRTAKKPKTVNDVNSPPKSGALDLRYNTLFYEFALFKKKYYEVDIPIEFGLGRYVYDVHQAGLNTWHEQGPVIIYGLSAQLIIKPVRWIGLVGMGGYRYTTFSPNEIRSTNPNAEKETQLDFRNFYYSYGVWIDLRQIIRDTRFYGFKRPKYRKNLRAILASEG